MMVTARNTVSARITRWSNQSKLGQSFVLSVERTSAVRSGRASPSDHLRENSGDDDHRRSGAIASHEAADPEVGWQHPTVVSSASDPSVECAGPIRWLPAWRRFDGRIGGAMRQSLHA